MSMTIRMSRLLSSPWQRSFGRRTSLAAVCRVAAIPRYFLQYRCIASPCIRRASLVLALKALSPRTAVSAGLTAFTPLSAVPAGHAPREMVEATVSRAPPLNHRKPAV